MNRINPKDFIDRACFELKYCDSKGWTVPVILTEKRLDEIYNDLSIDKIKLTTDEGKVYELDFI